MRPLFSVAVHPDAAHWMVAIISPPSVFIADKKPAIVEFHPYKKIRF